MSARHYCHKCNEEEGGLNIYYEELYAYKNIYTISPVYIYTYNYVKSESSLSIFVLVILWTLLFVDDIIIVLNISLL